MSRLPDGLAAPVAIAGMVLIGVSAALQILVLKGSAGDVEDGRVFASYVLNGLGTAGAFVLAAGIVLWLRDLFAAGRDA